MKRYLLLRDNVESGPFDLAQLSTKNLAPTDLIWVEGFSHSWRFPTEIEEIAHLVQPPSPKALKRPQNGLQSNNTANKKIFVALPLPRDAQPVRKAPSATDAPEMETHIAQPLESLKERLEKHRQQRRFKFNTRQKQNNLFGMAALFAGLLAGAFMIKKMVDATGEKESRSLAVAALPANAYPHGAQKEADATYHNALTTEVMPLDTITAKPKAAKKKVALKKLVTITASDFKKGVFGGINNLELKVKNKSDHHLDKVAIEVAYLKPNGEVIKKENYSLRAVAPKSTKNLVIPPSKRGVDIKYRITNIQSQEARASMRDI